MRLIAAYLAERFRPALFLPATASMSAAVAWSARETSGSALARASALGLVLLLLLRLWDDMEDRERDRAVHPGRVLVGAPQGPFRVMAVVLALAAAAACAGRPAAFTAIAITGAGLLAGYRLGRPRIPDASWAYGLLLLKYPAILIAMSLAAGPAHPERVAAAAAAAYTCASAYEFWHERRPHPGVPS